MKSGEWGSIGRCDHYSSLFILHSSLARGIGAILVLGLLDRPACGHVFDITDVLVILNTAVGSLMTLLGQAFNFEFGSSRSSGEKTDHFAEIMRTMAQNATPPAASKK